MSSFRAAVIGCGNIGFKYDLGKDANGIQTHTHAYRANPKTQLVGVADSSKALAEECARTLGTKAYFDLSSLLQSERPEILSICTPNATHFQLLKETLEFPSIKAVVIEKPLALTLEEAKSAVALSHSKKIPLVVNYGRRFAANHKTIREILHSKKLGRLRFAHGYYSKGLLHNGTHMIDLLRYLDSDFSEVRAEAAEEGREDPGTDFHFRLRSGTEGFVKAVGHDRYAIFELDLFFEKGRLRIFDSGQTYEVSETREFMGVQALSAPELHADGLKDLMRHLVENLIDHLTQGTPLRCTGEDGLRAIEIAQMVRESVRCGFKTVNSG